jgi:hypothetical protein
MQATYSQCAMGSAASRRRALRRVRHITAYPPVTVIAPGRVATLIA